mgnify:CR=1 FL=1
MNNLKIFKFALAAHEKGESPFLVIVADHTGSSPGKQGFKMVVSSSDGSYGTIGGGKVEYDIISQIKEGKFDEASEPVLIHSVHDPKDNLNSGMICSGSQSQIIIKLTPEYLEKIKSIISVIETGQKVILEISKERIAIYEGTKQTESFSFLNQDDWLYREVINNLDKVFIVGAGHVGSKLAEVMRFLDFYTVLIDNRAGLESLKNNQFADEKIITDYPEINKIVEDYSYAVILTHNHEYDLDVLRELLKRNLKYLGMIGSKEKVNSTFLALLKEGIDEKELKKVKAPIGISINSITAEEIAISIAAEIIKVKNG